MAAIPKELRQPAHCLERLAEGEDIEICARCMRSLGLLLDLLDDLKAERVQERPPANSPIH
jgi:hypothetical protein